MDIFKNWFAVNKSLPSAQLSFDDLTLLARSSNGYERERALVLLYQQQNIKALPVFIERLNDWVPKIRRQAELGFFSLLNSDNADVFASYLGKILQLQCKQRHDHHFLLEKVIALFKLAENQHHLVKLIVSNDQKMAFMAVKICADDRILPAGALVELAIKSGNIVALRYLLPLIEDMADGELAQIAEPLLRLKSPAILRKVIHRLAKLNMDLVIGKAQTLLFCRHAELRKLARHYLALSDAQAIKLYADALQRVGASPGRTSSCLKEIASLTGPDALYLLRRYLNDDAPNVRKTALQLLAGMLGDDAKHALFHGVIDLSNAVSNESVRLIVQHKVSISPGELVELYHLGGLSRLPQILRLAKKIGRWSRILVLLAILPENPDDEGLVRLINGEISQWNLTFNSGYSVVSLVELAELQRVFVEKCRCISMGNRESISFVFRIFGK